MSYSIRQNPSPFFTAGRIQAVNKIILHHAATTDFDGIGRTFKSQGVSAHYGVGRNNNVDQYVAESNTAYHSGITKNGLPNPNPSSIGIENVNTAGEPNWPVDNKTVDTLVELVYDVARRHNLLPLVVGKNLFQHKDWSNTYCAGRIGDRIQEIADRVNAKTSNSTPTPTKRSDEEIAREVLNGKWGNNPARADSLKRAGYNPDTIQARVNAMLGAVPSKETPKSSLADVARQVIAGSFGNNPARAENLKLAGYNPDEVQNEVNRQLGVGSKPIANLESVADAVIRGEYGNNPGRSNALRAKGYDPNAVQAIVNRKLGF